MGVERTAKIACLAVLMCFIESCLSGGCSSHVPNDTPKPELHDQSFDVSLGDMPDEMSATQLPEQVEAKRAWSVYTMCPGVWSAPDHLTRHDAFIRTREPGSTDEVLSFNLKLPLSAGGYPTTVAMVSLDVKTGKELGCMPLPIPQAVGSEMTRYDPKRRVAFYAFHTRSVEGGGSLDGMPTDGVLGIHVDTGETAFKHTKKDELNENSANVIALAFDRTQVVSNLGTDGLISLDAHTGEVLWTLDSEIPGRAGTSWSLRHLSTPTPDKLFLLDSWKELFEIDNKGQVTHRHSLNERGGFYGPLFIGDMIVLEEHGFERHVTKILSDWGGPVVHEEPDCGSFFTLGPKRLGCVEFSQYSQQARIVGVNIDGTQRVERTLKVPEGIDRVILHEVLALSSRHVAVSMSGSRKDDDGFSRSVRDVYIVDLEQSELEPTHVELVKEERNLGDDLGTTPIFTRSGVLIIAARGAFYGIQTNIPWTDRGPAPRGVWVSDNQNSGYAWFGEP